jgi:hypothetical protein
VQRLSEVTGQYVMKVSFSAVFFLGFLTLVVSCKKHEPVLTNEGVITGVDYRACLCTLDCPCECGGFLFHFTDMSDTSRTIIDNNSIFQFQSNDIYPIRVTVEWQNTSRCGTKAMKVLSYKLL